MWNFLTNATAIEYIAVSLFIGATLASIGMFINKNVIGSVARALIERGASDPGSALTLSELGLSRNFFVKNALKGNGALRKLVNEAEDRVIMLPDGSSYFERETKLDINSARFYIREESRIRAELRYSKKGNDVLMLILSIVVYFGVAWLITIVVPFMLDLFNQVIS